MVGLWFLVAEHLRLGTWDLLKGFTGSGDMDIAPRIAMQIVNEAALCQNRVRKKNYISHQGFELANGLGFLASDEQVHALLDQHTVSEAQALQETLAKIRQNKGHYKGEIIAIDPHRIVSTSKRIMPKKKKQPKEPSRKMLQTFFALDTQTGQPIGCTIGSSGVNTTKATFDLLNLVNSTCPQSKPLILADKEHFTEKLISGLKKQGKFSLLIPVITTERIKKIEHTLEYKSLWAGYSVAETTFSFTTSTEEYRLITQREGELATQYRYKSFIALSNSPIDELFINYDNRWSIEEFFNFEGAMGFDRASTFNLNIRYGKMSLALLAQTASYQLRQKLPKPYSRWDSTHLAEAVFNNIDGDICVKGDTIIITCYNVPDGLKLKEHYQNLPEKLESEGVNLQIPWLYNFKLDFRFK